MQESLSELLIGKLIICSCEGVAEQTIINLLMDNERLCFNRNNLVDGDCTRIRPAVEIAKNFLTRAYSQDIAILRILDKENDVFKIPKVYQINRNIKILSVVTKPEIEILHIIAEGLLNDFQRAKRRNKNLRPSEFFQGHVTKNFPKSTKIKSSDYVENFYSDIEKLVKAIKTYHQQVSQNAYDLSDLLA